MLNKVTVITLISFLVYFVLDELFFRSLRTTLNETINQIALSHILTYLIIGTPIFIGVLVLHGSRNFLKSLGLDQSPLKAFLFALLCTLPMFIGYGIVFEFNTNFSWNLFWVAAFAAAVFEELYFRAFLFGQLYRYTRLGFIPSVLLGALLFGAVHLYQGSEFGEVVGIFFVTFMGGILFAWTYVEWNYNLWVPIFLHMLMNLSWELFSAGNTALGGMYSNLFRIMTITLIIVLTIIYKKRNGKPLEVNRRTLWMKAKASSFER